jgi:hypothetical protein
MKRKITYSLLLGLILVVLSLFYKTGASNLEPMPYVNGGCGHGGFCGVVVIPQGGFTASTSLAKRGLPLPVVSLQADEDNPSNYYKSLIVSNLLIDYLAFTVVCFGLLTLPSLKKSGRSVSKN